MHKRTRDQEKARNWRDEWRGRRAGGCRTQENNLDEVLEDIVKQWRLQLEYVYAGRTRKTWWISVYNVPGSILQALFPKIRRKKTKRRRRRKHRRTYPSGRQQTVLTLLLFASANMQNAKIFYTAPVPFYSPFHFQPRLHLSPYTFLSSLFCFDLFFIYLFFFC